MQLHGFEGDMLMSSSDLKSINGKKKLSLFINFGATEGTVLVRFGAIADGWRRQSSLVHKKAHYW